MINLSIPLLGVGMAIGGIAWEYRKYYEAQMGLLTGVGSGLGRVAASGTAAPNL
jgi:hypothetical protein